MTPLKYAEYVKRLPIGPRDEGWFRQVAEMDSAWLGFDVNIKYGAGWTTGRSGPGPGAPHVHDYDQVLLFAGSDMDDIGELGAEVRLGLGEDLETHVITATTAVAIPKGLPHSPAAVTRLDKRFIYMEISLARECRETILDRPAGGYAPFRSKTSRYVWPLAFMRKGAWHYGPQNHDDGGGYIAFINTGEAGFDFVMLYESMKKAPYRIGPVPDKPHTHPTTQIMCFLGTDTDDLGELGADFEICLGKEEEKYTFNKSTAVLTPPYLPHWPGGLVRLEKPIIMADIHPFGNDH